MPAGTAATWWWSTAGIPSSKVCSACKAVRDMLPLNVREWTCDCGAVHDRDVNAANNILCRRAGGVSPVETV